jgi:hypothetical protein
MDWVQVYVLMVHKIVDALLLKGKQIKFFLVAMIQKPPVTSKLFTHFHCPQ